MEPGPPALGARSLSHWTSMGVLPTVFLNINIMPFTFRIPQGQRGLSPTLTSQDPGTQDFSLPLHPLVISPLFLSGSPIPLPLLSNLPVVKSAQGKESGFQDRKRHDLSSCRSIFLILITSLGYFNFCKTISHKACFFSSGSVLCNTLPTLALFLKQSVPLGAQGLGVPAHRTVRGGAWAPPPSLSPDWQPQAGLSAPSTRFRDRLGVAARFGSKVVAPGAPGAAGSLAAQTETSPEPPQHRYFWRKCQGSV